MLKLSELQAAAKTRKGLVRVTEGKEDFELVFQNIASAKNFTTRALPTDPRIRRRGSKVYIPKEAPKGILKLLEVGRESNLEELVRELSTRLITIVEELRADHDNIRSQLQDLQERLTRAENTLLFLKVQAFRNSSTNDSTTRPLKGEFS